MKSKQVFVFVLLIGCNSFEEGMMIFGMTGYDQCYSKNCLKKLSTLGVRILQARTITIGVAFFLSFC